MFIKEHLNGNYINLRSVSEEDAKFILELRLNQTLSKFLNSTSPDIETQQEWIKQQNKRKNDYYFVVIDSGNNEPIGLASIYNINENEAEYGRWISKGNAFQNLETVILLFDFAFLNLNISKIVMNTVKENSKVISFWKRFGAQFVKENYTERFVLVQNTVDYDVYFNIIRPKMTGLLNLKRDRSKK